MSSQLATPCPLVNNGRYQDLSDDSRFCGIPVLRSRFVREHPDQPCTCDNPHNQCLVYELYPSEAAHEIHLRMIANQRALKNREYSNLASAGI